MYKIHIFDLDGTLLDSMRMWDDISINYIRSLGYSPDSDLAAKIDPLTFNEAVEYLAQEFNIEGGADGVVAGMQELLVDEYTNKLQLFDDAMEILENAAGDNLPMIIFSNSPHKLIEPAIRRTGIDKYFSRVISTEDFGINKSFKEAFLTVCDMIGFAPEDCLVHDDSDYALDAAVAAGCQVRHYDRYR